MGHIEKPQKVNFPNLDGFRFISFSLVFWFHVQKIIFIHLEGRPEYSVLQRLFGNGELGVNFFFVLSGFLITYLLIQEKNNTGRVHILNFYARRILRIWPLFFLSVFLGFVVFPFFKSVAGFEPKEIANPIYYIFFLNNFDYINQWPQFPDALSLIVLWSVAVEEQFYLVWPLLLGVIRKNQYPVLFVAIIIASLVFRSFHVSENEHNIAVLYFHTFSVMGDLAAGALIAYYSARQGSFVNWLKGLNKATILFFYLGSILIILFKDELFRGPFLIIFERIIIAGFFGMLIAEQNYSQNSFFKLSKFKVLTNFGKYTYGLYCFHFMILSITQNVAAKAGFVTDNLPVAILVSLLALAVTIITAYVSFHYFEQPFLKLKRKFSFIVKE